MKPDWRFVLAEAERVAKCADGSLVYLKDEYGSAMLDLAKAEARPGESTASALSRLWGEPDARVVALYAAAERAPLLRKTGSRAGIEKVMNDYAAIERRQGETKEQAFDRLLMTDKFMKGAYAAYCEASP